MSWDIRVRTGGRRPWNNSDRLHSGVGVGFGLVYAFGGGCSSVAAVSLVLIFSLAMGFRSFGGFAPPGGLWGAFGATPTL